MKPLTPSRSVCVSCVFLVLLALAGCRHGQGKQDAVVRLINAAPGAQDLSVAVDGQRVWRHAQFRSNTGYQGVGEGTYQVEVGVQGNGGRLTGRDALLCQKGKAYTVVATSQNSVGEPPRLRFFSEEKGSPVPGNKIRVRFINAGTGLGPVDVLFNNILGFGDTLFANRTQGLLLDPGAYDVKIVAAGGVRSLAGPVSMHFFAGRAYTLVAMGRSNTTDVSQALTLESYPDDH